MPDVYRAKLFLDELRAFEKKGTLPNLERVMVPATTCMAVGEAAGWLAFGHERAYLDAHVSLVRLGPLGRGPARG